MKKTTSKSVSKVLLGTIIGSFAVISPAIAGIDEVRAGASIQSSGPLAPNVEEGTALAGEILFDAPSFLKWGPLQGRPSIGGSIATSENATSFGHAGLSWRLSAPAMPAFIDFGAGLAVHNGETSFDPATDFPRVGSAFLGCRALARLHVAPGVKIGPRVRASVQWEHLSNAGLCSENEGLDNLGFRLGVKF